MSHHQQLRSLHGHLILAGFDARLVVAYERTSVVVGDYWIEYTPGQDWFDVVALTKGKSAVSTLHPLSNEKHTGLINFCRDFFDESGRSTRFDFFP